MFIYIYFYEAFLLKCLQIPAEDLLKMLRTSVRVHDIMQTALSGFSEAL